MLNPLRQLRQPEKCEACHGRTPQKPLPVGFELLSSPSSSQHKYAFGRLQPIESLSAVLTRHARHGHEAHAVRSPDCGMLARRRSSIDSSQEGRLMHLLNWVDYRTLAAGQIPLAVVFATVLFGIWRVYPHLRGTDTMALGFSLWIPSTLLLVAQGSIPPFASTIGGGLLGICGYILLYRGLISFLQVKGHLPVLYDVAAVASAVVHLLHDDLRSCASTSSCCHPWWSRSPAPLWRSSCSRHSKERLPLQLFASFLSLFAILPVAIAVAALSPVIIGAGAPATLASIQGVWEHSSMRSFSLAAASSHSPYIPVRSARRSSSRDSLTSSPAR